MFYKYVILVFSIVLLAGCQLNPTMENPRERSSLDFDWRFTRGDVKGAENPEFDDSRWRLLDVPHDWSIEGTYNKDNPAGIAGAFLPTGIGWYRKTIHLDELNQDDKFFVEFDGVYMNSDVWINGHHLGNRPYGYISFGYDLTPYLKEGDNVLAVRVDHSKAPSGRWYTGSGIYRHVWLVRTGKVYIPRWGTTVTTPEVSHEKATVNLAVDILNETGKKQDVTVLNIIRDGNGEEVTRSLKEISLADSLRYQDAFEVKKPSLWSPDSPSMYSLETRIQSNGKTLEQFETPFGIRSVELRGRDGFYLNGEPVKFKGLSNHHDAGPVGAAVPDDVLYRRLKMLKEMGCNALRTTHNPFSPEFYTMCDTMGFMVMDEAFDGWWNPKAEHDYGHYFEEWWQQDLKDFMHRDRNHPSVVIWSIGNEVHGFTPEEQKTIVEFAKSIDDTRPITQGRGYMAPYIDIAGFNGHGEFRDVLENYHKAHPDRPIIGTEITHTLQTRGVYRTQTWYRTKDNPAPWEKPEHFARMEDRVFKIDDLSESEVFTGITPKYQSSYDNSIVRIGVRDDWKRVEENDWYMGNFRWTGFDYLGESFGWPARTANFGIIDLAGFPKDHYYLYQSLWSDKPMVHLLPHWTHPGKEGEEIPVVVYTNCGEAELFLNDKSLGRKEMGEERQLVWQVPYTPGTLSAVAYKDGQVVAQKSFETAGKPAALAVHPDKLNIKANRRDVVHCEVIVTDENGIMVPDAGNQVVFDVSGPARLLGVENGDILDMSPHKVNFRKAFKGKCLLILQSLDESGDIVVSAKSEGLEAATVTIRVD
jgi:beta-galactosidase